MLCFINLYAYIHANKIAILLLQEAFINESKELEKRIRLPAIDLTLVRELGYSSGSVAIVINKELA